MIKDYRFTYYDDIFRLNFIRCLKDKSENKIIFPKQSFTIEKLGYGVFRYSSDKIIIPSCKTARIRRFELGIVINSYAYFSDCLCLRSLSDLIKDFVFNIKTEDGFVFNEFLPISGYKKKTLENCSRSFIEQKYIGCYNLLSISDFSSLVRKKITGYDTLSIIIANNGISLDNLPSIFYENSIFNVYCFDYYNDYEVEFYHFVSILPYARIVLEEK